MDQFDRERYASVYRTLAEILDRDRSAEHEEHHLSYVLGDLTRRIFVGSQYLPPDELLEEVAHLLRTAEPEHLQGMAQRLRDHAQHLEELSH
jgi:hypothetical protein